MLATNAGLLTPILGDPSPWTPQRLYLNGEAGLWYDPGDLTAEKVNWRRNLLAWSEAFDNAAWIKSNTTITANAAVAPDGTTTADKLIKNNGATSAEMYGPNVASVVAGTQYTFSLFAKAAEYTFVKMAGGGTSYGNKGITVNLTTGAIAAADSGWTGSVVNAGNGWFRIIGTATAAATETGNLVVYSGTSASFNDTGNGSNGLFAWGAMLERGTTASAYQRITDFTSDFLAAFPTHALYQDSTGTTPVTALGQPVGLALDKSRGGLANVGPSRIANGAVGLTGTATPATYSTTTGVGTAVRVDPSNQSFVQFSGLTGNGMFLITVQNTGAAAFTLRTGSDSGAIFATVAAGTTARVLGQANAFGFLALVPSTGTIAFTVLGFNEVPGVHKIQPTSASREALDARVNLLTYSEQFDNAAWQKNATTITANSSVAPDGTTTMDTMVNTTVNAIHGVWEDLTVIANVPFRLSWYVKKNTVRYLALGHWGGISLNCGAGFDLDTGTVTGTGGIGAGVTASDATIEDVGGGIYRIGVTITQALTVIYPLLLHRTTAYTSGSILEAYTGSTSESTFIWGADLRLATDAAYPYQRVVTATDYADVGVPRSFLHDGFDDSSYTASSLDLSGTDKVTVWAGVYKNSDAARGAIVEHSSSYANAGAFGVLASDGGAANYQFGIGGATGNADYVPTGFAAPISRVLSSEYNLAGASKATTIIPRVNGALAQSGGGGTTVGGGNFQNAVTYFGRRNNASLPFNGKVYCIIIRGGVTDAATLALTERYVGSRMGIVL
jgi:hypothetical protein